MAIPDTQIQVFKGIPWDKSYADVRLFDSAAARDTYFNSKAVRTFTKFVYQRHDSATPGKAAHSIKVECHADQIRTCNYLRFRNQSVPSVTPRWFYGFIIGINYINPNTCEIVYELDDFQNWFYDCDLVPCQILREHANYEEEYGSTQGSDTLAINLDADYKFFTPENISPNTYMSPSDETCELTLDKKLQGKLTPVITVLTKGWETEGERDYRAAEVGDETIDFSKYLTVLDNSCYRAFGGVSTGWVWQFPTTSPGFTDFRKFILWLNKLPNSYAVPGQGVMINGAFIDSVVITAYLSPGSVKQMYNLNRGDGSPDDDFNGTNFTINTIQEKPSTFLQGSANYIRNRKLYFSPYRKIAIQSLSGERYETSFEAWSRKQINGKNKLQVNLKGTPLPRVRLTLRPSNSQYIEQNSIFVDYTTDNQIAFSYNPELAVLANQMNIDPLGTAAHALNMMASSGGNLATMAMQLGESTYGMYTDMKNAELAASPIIGRIQSSDNSWLFKKLGFLITSMVPSDSDVARIDDYFDYYGYNANGKIAIPRLEGRDNWNYCKTANCYAEGDIPEDSRRAIEAIFNKGARFWHRDPDPSIITNPITGAPEPEPKPDPDPDPDDPSTVKIKDPCDYTKVTLAFGAKDTGVSGRTIHTANDVTGGNKKIYSIADGVVFKVIKDDTTYGNAVIVSHQVKDEVYAYSIYAHLDSVSVKKGTEVNGGTTKLGVMGNTGASTGEHLHCALYSNPKGKPLPDSTMPRGYLYEGSYTDGKVWMKESNSLVYYDWRKLGNFEGLLNAMKDAGVIS